MSAQNKKNIIPPTLPPTSPILNANSCKFSPIILIGCLFIAVFELKLWQGKGLITMQNAINHHATGVTVSGSKCIVKEFPVERQLTPSNSPRQVTSYSQLSTSLCHKNFLSFILPFFDTRPKLKVKNILLSFINSKICFKKYIQFCSLTFVRLK